MRLCGKFSVTLRLRTANNNDAGSSYDCLTEDGLRWPHVVHVPAESRIERNG